MTDPYGRRYEDDDYPEYSDERWFPPEPVPEARGVARVPQPIPPPPSDRRDADSDDGDPLSLIPGPDQTTLLPRIPRRGESAPMPAEVPESRRKRVIRRHRDDDPAATRKSRKTVRIFAEVFVTFGALVLLFSAYVIWGTAAEIKAEQGVKEEELVKEWEGPEDPTLDPLPGEAIARLYLPQIREDPWIIVEGTDLDDIKTAPGHFEDAAMPGEPGNFAMAGHNVPAIFRHIDVLKPGDLIVVETKSNFFIYEITGDAIVKPTDVGVVAPVPNEPGVTPGEDDNWLTMLTCYPWWDNYERYIVWAKLVDTRERGDALPPEAAG